LLQKSRLLKLPESPLEVHPKGDLEEGRGTPTDNDSIGSDQSDIISEPPSVAHKKARKGMKLQLRISKNLPVQAQIKQLWDTTDLTRERIAESIDYPRATVQKWINKCLEDGSLLPRDSDQKA